MGDLTPHFAFFSFECPTPMPATTRQRQTETGSVSQCLGGRSQYWRLLSGYYPSVRGASITIHVLNLDQCESEAKGGADSSPKGGVVLYRRTMMVW